MPSVRDYVDSHRQDLLADLDAWLRIAGISAVPAHHPDVARSAQWLADAARAAGFPTVEVWGEGPWLPAVYAEWRSDDADAPVVLVYGHHDVQPVDPLELWHTDPFDPTVDGDVLRARGASDDKGQLLFHLLGLRAHLAAREGLAQVPDLDATHAAVHCNFSSVFLPREGEVPSEARRRGRSHEVAATSLGQRRCCHLA